MTDFESLLGALVNGQVAFIVIGGSAAIAHGSSRFTQDLDVVYQRSAGNLARLATALAPLQPYLRGAPPGLPFRLDQGTLASGLNFTLSTAVGDIDILGEIPGGGSHDDLLPGSIQLTLFGWTCRCLSLTQLIRAKRAAGRPKDIEAIAELEAIIEEDGD